MDGCGINHWLSVEPDIQNTPALNHWLLWNLIYKIYVLWATGWVWNVTYTRYTGSEPLDECGSWQSRHALNHRMSVNFRYEVYVLWTTGWVWTSDVKNTYSEPLDGCELQMWSIRTLNHWMGVNFRCKSTLNHWLEIHWLSIEINIAKYSHSEALGGCGIWYTNCIP